MNEQSLRLVVALLAAYPVAAHAQSGLAPLDLPQTRLERPIIQVPGRAGRAERASFRDGVSETVRYAGRDRAEIRVQLSGPRNGTGPTLSMVKPTQDGIAAELAREFPGETMLVSRQPVHNAYGQVGMAVGERCVYAWQWIDSVGRRDDARDRLFATSGERPASLRVRLCRRPGESVADLARAVQRLRIGDPLTQAASPPARQRPRPVARRPAGDTPVASNPPARTATPQAPTAPEAPPRAPSTTPPAGGYAPVPLPSSAEPVGRRPFVTTVERAVPSAVPQPERPPVAPQPARPQAVPVPQPVTPGGEARRYVTDPPKADSALPATIVPRPAGGSSQPGAPFVGTLPPEAYRGTQR